jgi:hypothetical protein
MELPKRRLTEFGDWEHQEKGTQSCGYPPNPWITLLKNYQSRAQNCGEVLCSLYLIKMQAVMVND